MNKKFKTLLLFLILIMMFSLTSCSCVSCARDAAKKAKDTTNEFFTYICDEDYYNASNMLHEDSFYNIYNLEGYIKQIEHQEEIDFSNGVTLGKTTNFHMTAYSSSVNGSEYEFTYNAHIGNEDVEIYVYIVDNDKGYGIISFTIDD